MVLSYLEFSRNTSVSPASVKSQALKAPSHKSAHLICPFDKLQPEQETFVAINMKIELFTVYLNQIWLKVYFLKNSILQSAFVVIYK